jgi:hypothetical protein
LNGQKKMAITRELWIQYILPPSSLHYRCTMITTLCIENQNGVCVVYGWGTHVPFGLLFAKYMSDKGTQPIGGLFLSHGRRIGHNEMLKDLGFDTEHHVIIFVNLLMFFDQDKLEYQVEYPLTGGNEREGVLDKDTMRDAIDASIERGHIIKIVPEGDEAAPPPHKCYRVQQDQEQDLYHWSLYTAHHNRGMDLGIISRRKCYLRLRQSANLVRLQKTGCLRTASGVGN